MSKELETVILFQLDKTSRISKQYSQKALDQVGFGISIDQWVLLKIIEGNAPLSQKELADKSVRDPASITRTLDLLAKKDLIKRERVEGNRRQYHIMLTQNGQEFINEHMDMVKAHRQKSMEGFSEAELNLLKNMLLRIQNNMK